MQDRRAIKNTFKQGIRPEDHTNSVGLTKGVPMSSFWGEAKDQGMPATPGVPHVGQGKVHTKKPACGGLNKEGENCGARPVKGKGYCVGHLRQVNATLRDSNTS